MPFRLSWSYALRSLWRGGQRTLLALFCVAVGVMAIVALQLVGLSVNDALTGNIIAANGGDLRLDSILLPFTAADLAPIQRLQATGQVTASATSYEVPSGVVAPNGAVVPVDLVAVSPNFPLAGQANFIAPAANARIQDLVTGDHAAINTLVAARLGARLGDHFTARTGDGQTVPFTVVAIFQDGGAFHGPQVIVTAASLAAAPGPNQAPVPTRVTTVTLLVPAANLTALEANLRQQFPTATVTTAADELRLRQRDVDQIRLFLHIVSLLALFIGGIGVINTMQVMLRRRQLEIAVLKTMGYRQRDLYGLFGFEATALGLLGSVIGVGLGVAASDLVRFLVARAFFIQLRVLIDPVVLAGGLATGVATALIFGLLPIVEASQARPLAVLRAEAVATVSRARAAGLLLVLSALFVALATAIIGDARVAAVVVYGGAVVVGIIAAGFWLLIRAVARLPIYERPSWRVSGSVLLALAFAALATAALIAALRLIQGTDILGAVERGAVRLVAPPLAAGGLALALCAGAVVALLATLSNALLMFAPRGPRTALKFAYRNLGRQATRTTTTLTALFVGVFGIGAIVLLGQGIKDAVNQTITVTFSHNLFVVAAPNQATAIQSALPGLAGSDATRATLDPIARVAPVAAGGQDIGAILASLPASPNSASGIARRESILLALSVVEGFDLGRGAPPVVLTAGRTLGPADAGTTAVLADDILAQGAPHLALGQTITVRGTDGATRDLTIVGFFSRVRTTDFVPGELLVDAPLAATLGGAQTQDLFALKIAADQVPAARQQLAQADPGALVVSLTDLNAIFDLVLTNIIEMLTAITSLAVIAGLVIIANAVALAMLERRREIGILKSLGHTSRSVLAMVLIENGVIALLGALVAVTLVAGAMVALGAFVFQRALPVSVPLVGAIVGGTLALALTVAVMVAWSATRRRPLEVLRYE